MSCDICGNTGYRRVEVPVFADGGYGDVEQIEARCACNPEPTDEDYLSLHPWHDTRAGYPGETPYPADLVLPVIDYDPTIAADLLA